MLWEDKFAPVNMTSCVRPNVRENREVKNSEQCLPQTETCKIILIVVIRKHKDVQHIRNRALYIYKTLQTLPSVLMVYVQNRNKMVVRKIVRNFITTKTRQKIVLKRMRVKQLKKIVSKQLKKTPVKQQKKNPAKKGYFKK